MNEAENNPGRARVLEGTAPSLRKHKGVSCSRQSWVPAYTVTAIWRACRGRSTSSPEFRPETELGCRPHCPITGTHTPAWPHVQRPLELLLPTPSLGSWMARSPRVSFPTHCHQQKPWCQCILLSRTQQPQLQPRDSLFLGKGRGWVHTGPSHF